MPFASFCTYLIPYSCVSLYSPPQLPTSPPDPSSFLTSYRILYSSLFASSCCSLLYRPGTSCIYTLRYCSSYHTCFSVAMQSPPSLTACRRWTYATSVLDLPLFSDSSDSLAATQICVVMWKRGTSLAGLYKSDSAFRLLPALLVDIQSGQIHSGGTSVGQEVPPSILATYWRLLCFFGAT